MTHDAYDPPAPAGPKSRRFELVIRIALLATYPLLAVSLLLLLALLLQRGWLAEFTVENRTAETIVVTPVGTVGTEGSRYPLPIYMWSLPPIWSAKCGGFELSPGESLDILYDMDDINFSEMIVEDAEGQMRQLVVDPNPTENQYHAPAQDLFVIDSLDSLATSY